MSVTPPFGEQDENKVFWEIEVEPGATKTETFTAPKAAGTYHSTIKFFYLDRTGTCGSRHTGRCPIFQ
jgi:hypothetical protein